MATAVFATTGLCACGGQAVQPNLSVAPERTSIKAETPSNAMEGMDNVRFGGFDVPLENMGANAMRVGEQIGRIFSGEKARPWGEERRPSFGLIDKNGTGRGNTETNLSDVQSK